MRRSTIISGVIFTLTAMSIFSCQHSPEDIVQPEIPGNDPPMDTLICDSTDVSYAGTIYPILQSHCLSCHSGPNPTGNLNFNSYEVVAAVAENGRLMGAINHEPGYSPMPPSGNQISACEIGLVQKWINDTTFSGGMTGGGIPCDPEYSLFPE